MGKDKDRKGKGGKGKVRKGMAREGDASEREGKDRQGKEKKGMVHRMGAFVFPARPPHLVLEMWVVKSPGPRGLQPGVRLLHPYAAAPPTFSGNACVCIVRCAS